MDKRNFIVRYWLLNIKLTTISSALSLIFHWPLNLHACPIVNDLKSTACCHRILVSNYAVNVGRGSDVLMWEKETLRWHSPSSEVACYREELDGHKG